MEIEKIIFKIISDITNSMDSPKNSWEVGSKYLSVKNLNNDETGEVGELLLADIFSRNGNKVEFDKAITAVGKDWDIVIDNIRIEVKTATIGSFAKTFQHEKFFQNRNYDAVVFLDFAPNELYVTIFRKEDIVWEELTKRKVDGYFTSEYKFDMSIKMVKEGKTKKIKAFFSSLITNEKDLIDLFNAFEQKFYNSIIPQ